LARSTAAHVRSQVSRTSPTSASVHARGAGSVKQEQPTNVPAFTTGTAMCATIWMRVSAGR
jgi:hypothetical protein